MNILIPDSWLREYLSTDATPSQIQEYLSLCGPSVERISKSGDDFIYDIEITTNRIDMASVYGIAREAAAILPRFGIKATLKRLHITNIPLLSSSVPMKITDPHHLCNRIMGVVIEVGQMKPSTSYMKDRIEKSGVRSLNNLVDITNFVMLELGHPCHVFDYDRVKTNTFIIRKAKKNEPIVTLDGKKYALSDQDVIIDDGTGKVIDLPGIMGTENSVVTDKTRRIIFFIESNNPSLIRKTSMRYGIRTMAASINEKHPDPNLVETALLRGIELYQKEAGGKVIGNIIDLFPNKPQPKTLSVSREFINERLGIMLPQQEIEHILNSLSFVVQETKSSELLIIPPSYRQFDISIPEDIVEEVARIYGYHKLPSRIMAGVIPVTEKPKDLLLEHNIKQMLKYTGFTETYSYSFISKDLIEKSDLKLSDHLKLLNPLTEEIEYMRISLIPSLLRVVHQNQSLTQSLHLFELAKVYVPQQNNLPDEFSMLTIITVKDFLHLKGLVEYMFEELGIGLYQYEPGASSFFHPKQSVTVLIGNVVIGYFGVIHPNLQQSFSLNKQFCIIDLNVEKILPFINPVKRFTPIPIYPPVIEDITLKMSKDAQLGSVIDAIRKTSTIIAKIDLIDSYNAFVTLRITYQDTKSNLSAEIISPIRTSILSMLQKKYTIVLKT